MEKKMEVNYTAMVIGDLALMKKGIEKIISKIPVDIDRQKV